MNWRRFIDPIFPVIEPFGTERAAEMQRRLEADLVAIRASSWSPHDERALDEAQKIANAEAERVKTAESKATTYLAVLAALVPLILTIQAANWEKKSGPAPEWLKLVLLAVATTYTAAAGFHAFKTLQVSGFHRVSEAHLTSAGRLRHPWRRLARETLIATRLSRDTVNAKVTNIRLTHAHLLRAFAAFVLLLLLDPVSYALGLRPLSVPEAQTPPTGPADRSPNSVRRGCPVDVVTLPVGANTPTSEVCRDPLKRQRSSPRPAPSSSAKLPSPQTSVSDRKQTDTGR